MTIYKSQKIGKTSSLYIKPIGFHKVSDILGGFPHIETIKIVINDRQGEQTGQSVPGWHNRKLNGNTSELVGFNTLLSCNYTDRHQEWDDYLEYWTINIFACPKDKQIKISDFTQNIALPIIKDWLATLRHETWFIRAHYLQIGINHIIDKYCILETEDNNIVQKTIKEIPPLY